MYHFTLPIAVMLNKKKRYPLNLNHYRNAHFRENHKGKDIFDRLVRPKILGLPVLNKVLIIYKIFPQRKSDTNNIGSIVDKFFCDTLVQAGRLPDDNGEIVQGILSFFGGVDPKNPRAEVTICPIDNLEQDLMKITIDQSEIETAIKNYIGERVALRPNQEISIGLAATRGDRGFTAEIDITDVEVEVVEVVEATAPVAATTTKRAYTRKAPVEPVEIAAETAEKVVADTLVQAVVDTAETAQEVEETAEEAPVSSALEDAEEAAETLAPAASGKKTTLFGRRSD